MNTVSVPVTGALNAVELKNSLVDQGLTVNLDFEWEYNPSMYETVDLVLGPRAVFRFRDPALATFYQLKWGAQ